MSPIQSEKYLKAMFSYEIIFSLSHNKENNVVGVKRSKLSFILGALFALAIGALKQMCNIYLFSFISISSALHGL